MIVKSNSLIKQVKGERDDLSVVLLVDDNKINLQTLYEILDGQGYKLLVARSGEDALRISDKAGPDLILLDVMMPGIDGYETCRRIKEQESTRDSTVIFLSALQSPQDKVKGLSLGAVDFITKPFDPEEILARVSRQLDIHLQHKRLRAEIRQLAQQRGYNHQELPEGAGDRSEWTKLLIEKGENDRVEFKSTLRWNLKTDRAEKVIEKSWLKSIVAFLNTDGGTLLVGVGDSGEILGTEADQFENEDKYMLHVNNLIREHIGLEFVNFIRFHLVPIEGRKVLLIRCESSPSAVFFKFGKNEEFYVRVGPGNRRLSTSEVLTYVTNRNK